MLGFNIFSGDDWLKLFNVILLAPMQGLCWIVYFCEAIFWTLVIGFKDSSGQTLNLIEVVLNGTVVQKIILGSLIAASLIIFLFAIIAIIKQYTTYKEEPNNKAVVADTLKSIILMVAIPALTLAIIWMINSFTDAMVTYLNGSAVDPTNPATSIANHIFVTLGNWKPEIPTTDICFNIGTYDLVENYYANPTDLCNYQYIIGYVVAFVLFFNLGKATLQAGKRVFDVALLYAVAPLTVSTYPLDKGKRWNIWLNIFISKMLNVLGMIYAYFIFIALMQSLKNSLGITGTVIDFKDLENCIKNISYIVVVVAGAMAVGNAPTLIGHLISEQAGNIAQADAAAIDSDLKWGTMMGGKVFGTACNFAKAIYEGAGRGGRRGGGSGGALGGSSPFSTFTNKLSTLKNEGISGLRHQRINKNRANKLSNIRKDLIAGYGNEGINKKEYLSKMKQYKRMTGKDFNAKDVLRDYQEREAMSKAHIDSSFINNTVKAKKK